MLTRQAPGSGRSTGRFAYVGQPGVHDLGIVTNAGVLAEMFANFADAIRGPIGAMRRHCVKYIGHSTDFRPYVHFVAGDTRRIATAVQPLMMLIYHHELLP